MSTPHSYRGSRIPTQFYHFLRRHHREILAMEARQELSQSQRAALLNIHHSMYRRVIARGPAFMARVQEASVSGDWSAIEDELFSKYGYYRSLPSFREVLRRLDEKTRPLVKQEPLPFAHSESTAQERDERSAKLRHWLLLGETMEQFLTPRAVAILLKLAKE